jgi:hypothetical protein
MFDLNDDSSVPPLPKEILILDSNQTSRGEFSRQPTVTQFLKPGCWIIQFIPSFSDDVDPKLAEFPVLHSWTVHYLGTLRVECPSHHKERGQKGSGIIASGDLYVERQNWAVKKSAKPPMLPQPLGVPVYPRNRYSFYFTLEEIVVEQRDLVLMIATYRFNSDTLTWGTREVLTTRIEIERTPAAWRSSTPKHYLWGLVYNERGTQVGQLEMGWISPYLRAARVEIAAAAGLEPPVKNGKGDTLEEVFKKVGWDLSIAPTVEAKGPTVWQEKDLHAEMLKLRPPVDLDLQWVYHVLVVPRFYPSEEYAFGKMYDIGALDTDLVPREGLVVASEARFPQEPRFGEAGGLRLMDVPEAAFHNLVHELGHEMGLLHRFHGADFMQALIHIASQSSEDAPFPENLIFKFDSQDELRLRHYPDIWVRPGGVPFAQGSSALPVPDVDAITDVSDQFEFYVEPLARILPLGVPVKLQLRLTNKSQTKLPGPKVLSLSDGSVYGRVIGPGSEARSFSAAAPLDFMLTADLLPGDSLFR